MADLNPDGALSLGETEYVDGTGQVISAIHLRLACKGRACVIHNPSEHSMRSFRTHFRRGYPHLGEIKPPHMERICPHGVGHPDPDDLAYWESIGIDSMGVHGCDGCCVA